MSIHTIDLHDPNSVAQLSEHLDEFKMTDKMGKSISSALEVLKGYKETFSLSPRNVAKIFETMNINDTFTPEQMNGSLVNNDQVYVLRKKYFNSYISKSKFEATLYEIIFEMAQSVSGEILTAIVSLIKNFSIVCELNNMNILYKELCFKFFVKDNKRNEILVLIMNLDYGMKEKTTSLLKRALTFVRSGLHLSFFGAVIRTSISDVSDNLTEDKKQSNE